MTDRSVKDVVVTDRRESAARELVEMLNPPKPPRERLIVGGGIHVMSAEDYHADPCPEPSLSSSIAKELCLSSPAHARQAHPQLNPQHAEEHADRFDIGAAAHALLLEGDTGVVVVDAPDWRTKSAREARAVARECGKTALLARVWADVQAMVKAARAQLDVHIDGGAEMFLGGGLPERTLVWQEDGVWCRARLDWLRVKHAPYGVQWAIDDFKSTSGSANPDSWTRAMFGMGFDLQAAWYLRGLKVLTDADASFRFAVQETYSPYALSVIALGPDALTIAEKKRLYALDVWRECLHKGEWPSYPPRTCYAMLPGWHEAWWLERELGGRI